MIRPIGGALIAVATLGHASPAVQGLVALLGGSLAAGSHFTKAGTRAVANTSPEPFTNWILSLSEDVFVVGLGFLALKYPGRGRARRPALCRDDGDRSPRGLCARSGDGGQRRIPNR